MRKAIETVINTENGPVRIRYLSEDNIDDMYHLLVHQYVDTFINNEAHDNYIPRDIKSRYIKVFE
jgi:hypothetical protein